MINVTKGFKNFNNIKVYRNSCANGIRFMITSDGIDICDENVDKYFVPSMLDMFPLWPDYYVYEITDEDRNTPPLTEKDKKDIIEYLKPYNMPDDEPWWVGAKAL